MNYKLSEIDNIRFGQTTAKAYVTDSEQVKDTIKRSLDDHVSLLIVRVDSDRLEAVHALECSGALLMDTLIYYERRITDIYNNLVPEGYTFRSALPSEAEKVEVAAQEAFEGYFGHYHADPKLEDRDCDLVYSSWAASSCQNQGPDAGVILIETPEDLSGPAAFATLKMAGANQHEGVLFGVSPRHRGKGLYPALMKLGINWGLERGSQTMMVSTQITNLTVQKSWCRLGFLPAKSSYTFHKWLK